MNSQSNKISHADNNDAFSEDINSQRQWETINDHLRQMSLWTDGTPSPLSSSPANKNSPVVTRPHNSQHNPLYRRSEGDIQRPAFEEQKASNPPQSAPVLENYELKWDVQDTNPIIEIIPEVDDNAYAAQSAFNHSRSSSFDIKNQENVQKYDLGSEKEILKGSSLTSTKKFSDHISDQSTHFGKAKTIHSSVSSPSLKVKHLNMSSHIYYDTQSSLFPHLQQSPSMNYGNSPSMRRRSAPHTHSVYPTLQTIPQALDDSEIHHILQTNLEEEEEEDSNSIVDLSDEEYTRSLLLHQRDRMHRLNLEFEAKKIELNELYSQVAVMEKKAFQKNSNNKPTVLPSLQYDVGRLREINRRLKIDCNCMYKEVELFSSYGDSTSDDFYSRYNRSRPSSIKSKPKKDTNVARPIYLPNDLPPPPLPPPIETIDEPKWRCTHCTFDNHAALNKCEMCDFSRAGTAEIS